jgi:hypothetical protein
MLDPESPLLPLVPRSQAPHESFLAESDSEQACWIRRFVGLILAVLGVWLACELAALAGVYESPIRRAIYNNHFYGFPLLTFTLFFMMSGPTRRQMWLAFASTGALTWGI